MTTRILAFEENRGDYLTICTGGKSHFYVGVDGGWSKSINRAARSFGVGEAFNGTAYYGQAMSGYTVGANIGVKCNVLFRADLSYTFFSNQYKWLASFPGQEIIEPFQGFLNTHLVLINSYLHLNAFTCLFPCFDPYIGGGIGISVNHLYDIEEGNTGFTTPVIIEENTALNFGARLGFGILRCLPAGFIADLGWFANYIGGVRTGETRTREGITKPIGVYIHRNNWISTLFLGLKKYF